MRRVGRKRRGSRPSTPPRRPTSAADACERSDTGCESSARIPAGSSSIVSGRPATADTASDHGPSMARPSMARPQSVIAAGCPPFTRAETSVPSGITSASSPVSMS